MFRGKTKQKLYAKCYKGGQVYEQIQNRPYILGISCFYYDSAICLVKDGEILYAVQEERFSRKKHDPNFPLNSIRYCLKEEKIDINDLDFIGFYDNSFKNRFKILYELKKINFRKKVIFFDKKTSYLASAFYPSYFKEAVILVNDGDKVGLVLGRGKDNIIEPIKNKDFNYSLGKLYSAITHYLGFKENSDEYKVMGLSGYGKPKYKDLILKNKDRLLNTSFKKINKVLEEILDRPARKKDVEITEFHMDIASSIQKATEEETLKITEYLYKTTGCVNLCLSGQLALNCLINSEILKQGFFKDIWIQPASTDAGCAVGVAFLIWYKYLNNKRIITDYQDKMKNAFLGPSYSDEEIENFLKSNGIHYKKLDYSVIPKITAELIIKGNIVGWFQARIEFGPRALGSRSILADSRNFQLKDRLNAKVKFREDFRPLAPTVLFEKKDEFFNLNRESPYMLFVAEVKKDKINQIPAVTHIDNSSRIQTIKREQNPLYYDTIYEFYKETGCPVIINTSFNTKDEPIVLTPQDAYRCFMRTEMDYLLMGSFLLDKKEQRPIEKSLF